MEIGSKMIKLSGMSTLKYMDMNINSFNKTSLLTNNFLKTFMEKKLWTIIVIFTLLSLELLMTY